ncbi:MAG: hypothetical protein F6K09_17990 [Merismopedia sp. SIO2A8]|nr:hypothetical protein [Merismopedia sp. SIO2A8]
MTFVWEKRFPCRKAAPTRVIMEGDRIWQDLVSRSCKVWGKVIAGDDRGRSLVITLCSDNALHRLVYPCYCG